MKRISILGSTGSVGRQVLEVIADFPERFQVVGLSAGENRDLLGEQILRFRPEIVSLSQKEYAEELKREIKGVEVVWGEAGAEAVASYSGADLVVAAIVGASGLKPTLSALRAGKNVALANKESLVMAGKILVREASRYGVNILPIDSEHSAIFQVLSCGKKEYVRRIILTASGGPLLRVPEEDLPYVTKEVALSHPTWNMGRKITIDSATLMNKGLEVIEAHWLFGIPPDKISVCIHPQSIVHSMVEYIDGSIIAQMSIPDMKIPIAYALSYPERIPTKAEGFIPALAVGLTFEEVDHDRFPALGLAYEAISQGGTMPAVMNAANEVAVEFFLNDRIKFTEITDTVRQVMELHKTLSGDVLEEVLESSVWAREKAKSIIQK